MPVRRLYLSLVLGCVLLTGCRSGPFRRPAPKPYYPPPSGGYTIPPANIPNGPPIPGRESREPNGNAELLLPESLPPGKSKSGFYAPPKRDGATLGEPDYVDPSKAKVAEQDDPPPVSSKPPETKAKVETASGIDDFTVVKDSVHAGRRPFIDGLDWLQKHGFKSVIHLSGKGEDIATDRHQVERRGMTFTSLIVTPETLNIKLIEEFNAKIGDPNARPVFVYSGDASLSAAVWYLHLRTAEFLTHDEARIRAARLGLKDEKAELFQAALKVVP